MERPILAPPPVVTEQAAVFRDLFENQCQVRHVRPDRTGLLVLLHKSLANSAALWRRGLGCLVPGGGHGAGLGPKAEELEQPPQHELRAGPASIQRRDATGGVMKLPGPHSAVEDLGPLMPAKASRPVTVCEHTDWCFTPRVRLPPLGTVRIVVRFERESLTGGQVVLVTKRVDWTAAKIIDLYWQRWPTDTFDQDGEGPLGFNAHRMRRAEALGKEGCLVFVASSLWHLTGLSAGPDRTQSLIHTIGDAGRQQGHAVLQQLLVFVHDQWSQGSSIDRVFAQVFAKPQGMVLG